MTDFFERLLSILPLEVFVFVGTAIDEIISPIPSFVVLVPAGVAAHVQSLPLWYILLVLGGLSAIARVVSGYLLYIVADRFEDVIFASGKTRFGVTHKEVEALGKRLSDSKPYRSWLALFGMHAIPIFPGTLLSLGSGFIKLKLWLFATATFAGALISAGLFLLFGYYGTKSATLLTKLDTTSQIVSLVFVGVLIGGGIALYFRRNKQKRRP